jgi:hypothetical protein
MPGSFEIHEKGKAPIKLPHAPGLSEKNVVDYFSVEPGKTSKWIPSGYHHVGKGSEGFTGDAHINIPSYNEPGITPTGEIVNIHSAGSNTGLRGTWMFNAPGGVQSQVEIYGAGRSPGR